MKNKLLILSFAISGVINAQTPSWEWAKSAGGLKNDDGKSIFYSNGYVYLTGNFQSAKIIMGSDTLINKDTTGKTADIFIAKYDSSGSLIWAKSAGGMKNDKGAGITADANGNTFVTGYFSSDTITFGTFTFKKYSTIQWDSADVFIVKYDPSGNVIWAKSAGGDHCDYGTGIAADVNGNCYVTGYYQSSSIVFGNYTFFISGGSDIFLIKYDGSGNQLWAKNTKGDQADWSTSVAVDKKGNSYLTGYFFSHVLNFGHDSVLNSCGGHSYMFAVKYDSLGNSIWANCAGGPVSTIGNDGGNSIAASPIGSCCVTGSFASESIAFETNYLVNHDFTGNTDIFIVEYSPSGETIWATGKGSPNCDDAGSGVAADANGNFYITGGFGGLVPFGNDTLNSNSGYLFAAKYDMTGNALWAKNGGAGTSPAYSVGSSISADANGSCYIAGYFQGNFVSFGNHILTNPVSNNDDICLAKLGSNALGISENTIENKINIFPNPFSSQATFYTDRYFNDVTLTVYNSYGQIAKQINNISGHAMVLFRDNLPSGLYFLRLSQADKIIATGKLIITDN